MPELNDFHGQMTAAITRQLGAVSSTLRMLNLEQNSLTLELVFQGGRAMSQCRLPKRGIQNFRDPCRFEFKRLLIDVKNRDY